MPPPTTRERTAGICSPESQSLLRVEVDILPGSELCADVDIPGGDESIMSLVAMDGNRFRACVGHW